MLLLGFLLLTFLTGFLPPDQLLPLFVTGIGVIFCLMAVLKAKVPGTYEMPAKTTLAYGVVATVIGVLWLSLSIQVTLAGYVLAVALIFFGLVFLSYTRIRKESG